jgi:endonuclease/exonuclease/phosphatase family metal-dependent hydrolase
MPNLTRRAIHCRLRAAAFIPWLVLGVAAADPPAPEAAADAPLCVMTFNLRYASERPPNAWPQRRPVMRDALRAVDPDLIGTQEGLYPQLKDLAADLPAHDWIGLGREGGSRGEFMAVFYRRDRLEPLEYDHFWLSDTPDVIASASWGNTVRRMVTWVRFRDRPAGREFYFWNTHLDHQAQAAREQAATLIRTRVDALRTALPVLLVGDFNATAGRNPAYATLVHPQAFTDTWHSARERRGDAVRTFHNFKGPVPGDDRIDWILTRGPVRCDATTIVTFHRDGQYPSDHFPVVAWLRWEQIAPPPPGPAPAAR